MSVQFNTKYYQHVIWMSVILAQLDHQDSVTVQIIQPVGFLQGYIQTKHEF